MLNTFFHRWFLFFIPGLSVFHVFFLFFILVKFFIYFLLSCFSFVYFFFWFCFSGQVASVSRVVVAGFCFSCFLSSFQSCSLFLVLCLFLFLHRIFVIHGRFPWSSNEDKGYEVRKSCHVDMNWSRRISKIITTGNSIIQIQKSTLFRTVSIQAVWCNTRERGWTCKGLWTNLTCRYSETPIHLLTSILSLWVPQQPPL